MMVGRECEEGGPLHDGWERVRGRIEGHYIIFMMVGKTVTMLNY